MNSNSNSRAARARSSRQNQLSLVIGALLAASSGVASAQEVTTPPSPMPCIEVTAGCIMRYAVASGQGDETNARIDGAGSATAFGFDTQAIATGASAFGYNAWATAERTLSMGVFSRASAAEAVAIGAASQASGAGSTAVGSSATALNEGGIAIGARALSEGLGTVAIGEDAVAHEGSIAIGKDVKWNAVNSVNIGNGSPNTNAPAERRDQVAIGSLANSRSYGVALGSEANASLSATAVGYRSVAGDRAVAVGESANAGVSGTALGAVATAADMATAVGRSANAAGTRAVAVGLSASAIAGDSVALGSDSFADEGNTVSFGNGELKRRLVHVAPGINGTDAVNVDQLNNHGDTLVNWMGGGSSHTNGVFSAPTFYVQGGSYFNAGDAFAAIDDELTNINVRIDGIGNGPAGADGRSAYEVAIDNGYVGTQPEWLASLRGTDGTNGTNGVDGIDGTDGTNGTNGRSAYELAIDGGFEGSEPEWLASLKGDKGDKGDTGTPGADGADGVGTPGASGRDGVDGTNGSNAYQLAVDDGFNGTETEWLASLNGKNGADGVGIDGQDGDNGRSAYEIAVDGGFAGSETEWVESLRGADGKDGTGSGGDVGNDLAVEYTDDSRQEVTLGGGVQGAVRVANVAAGNAATDAVNVAQLREQAEQTVRIANAYTDQQIGQLQQTWQGRWDNLDGRIRDVDRRVDRVGASSAALTMMASSGTHMETGQIAAQAGFGMYRNESALAAGLKARLSDRASLSIGGSFDGESTMGGVGFSWVIR